MKRPSPLVQVTMDLVAKCSTLVLLGSLFLNTMPGRRAAQCCAGAGQALIEVES